MGGNEIAFFRRGDSGRNVSARNWTALADRTRLAFVIHGRHDLRVAWTGRERDGARIRILHLLFHAGLDANGLPVWRLLPGWTVAGLAPDHCACTAIACSGQPSATADSR